MLKLNLQENELLKLKTIASYGFYDKYGDCASFPRFEDCFSLFIKGSEIKLTEVFKDICGINHKYITFKRGIIAFLRYKNTPASVTIDTKNFFSFVFKTLLRDESDIIGYSKAKVQKFNSEQRNKKANITKITVLTDNQDKIFGLKLVYDRLRSAKLFSTSKDVVLYNGFEFDLDFIPDDGSDFTENKRSKGSMNKITHIFGCFDTSLTSIGFKLSNGELKFYGKGNGTPFLIGAFGKVISSLKGEISSLKGVTGGRPKFIEKMFKKPYANITLEHVTLDFLNSGNQPIREENVCDGRDQPGMGALNSLISDDCFERHRRKKNERKGDRHYFTNLDHVTPLFNIEKYEKNRKKKEMDVDDILKEIELFERKRKKRKVRFDDKFQDKYSRVQPFPFNQGLINKHRPKHQSWSYDKFSNRYKFDPSAIFPNSSKHKKQRSSDPPRNKQMKGQWNKMNRWNYVSINQQPPDHFLFNGKMFDQLCSKFQDSIKADINAQKHRIQIANAYNFYDKYLENHIDFISRDKYEFSFDPEIKAKIINDQLSQFKDIYREYEAITMKTIYADTTSYTKRNKYFDILNDGKNKYENNNYDKEQDMQQIPEISYYHKFVELNKGEYLEKINEDIERKVVNRWTQMKTKLVNMSGVFIGKTIGAVINAVKLLKQYENNENSSVTIEKKIKLYNILEANKHIVKFLEQAKREIDERKLLTQEYEEEDESETDEEMREVEKETEPDEEEEEKIDINDLGEIDDKINSLEKILESKKYNKAIADYLDKLKTDKNKIIKLINENEKQEIEKAAGIDVEEIGQEEIKQREQIILEVSKEGEEKRKEEREAKHALTKIISVSNIEIPKDTKIYKGQSIAKPGTLFLDNGFPPELPSLCPVDKNGEFVIPEDVFPYEVEGWNEFKWERSDVIFGSPDYQVFEEGINPDDIIQGDLGNCYFLSAVSALCKFPKGIEKLFYLTEKSHEHCYGVYLRINGKMKLVGVDDYIPCSQYDETVFSQTNGNELWVIGLEKAWSKINGNYAKIIGGQPNEVFDVLTNAMSEQISISKSNGNFIWKTLINAEEKGFIMTAGTIGNEEKCSPLGGACGHAYSILGVKEVNLGIRKEKGIHGRNPWGSGEWSGEWCDSSQKWTDKLRKELDFYGIKDDGQFFMSFNDFAEYFGCLGICHLYSDYVYTYTKVKATQAIRPYITRITVTEATNAYIMLHQKNPRIILKDGTYQTPVISYMILCDKDFKYIAANTNAEMNLSIIKELAKGVYYLISDINYRYVDPERIHGYTLSCYSLKKVGGLESKDNSDPLKVRDIFHTALLSYAKENVKCEDRGDFSMYLSNSTNLFPFTFSIILSKIKSVGNAVDTLVYNGEKNVIFYLEGLKENEKGITKEVEQGIHGIFVHMPIKENTRYSHNLHVSAVLPSQSALLSSSDKKEMDLGGESESEEVFKEKKRKIDANGEIYEYVKQVKDGIYLGFENNSKVEVKFQIKLEGMFYVKMPNEKTIKFTIKAQGRHVCLGKEIDDFSGDLSYEIAYMK